MRRLGAVAGAILCVSWMTEVTYSQGSAPAALSSRFQEKALEKTVSTKAKSEGSESTPDSAEKSKQANSGAATEKPIVTEIYADQTVFDSAKSIGVFSGHVVVTDPRFNIQGDKLTVYISKGGQNESFEKAIVEGNVGVVREKPGANGGPPDRAVGRAEKAVYTAKDGRFELTGNPRVQQGLNTHVATSPETVMILNETGQLETRGPSRTEIRQDPNLQSSTPKP